MRKRRQNIGKDRHEHQQQDDDPGNDAQRLLLQAAPGIAASAHHRAPQTEPAKYTELG